MPTSVPVRYIGKDRINNFHVGSNTMRRLVSESYKAGSRNHKTPTTSNPTMLLTATSMADVSVSKGAEEEKPEAKRIDLFKKKSDFILQK